MTPDPERIAALSLRTDFTGWNLLEPEPLLGRIAEVLAPEFVGIFGPQTVQAYVVDAYQSIGHEARIRTYLPTLTAQIAHAALIERARAQEDIHLITTPEVLFVCVHNQGRSQMAAALLEQHAAGSVHVRSAGSAPADSISPAVVEVMAEVGLNLSRSAPRKLLTDDVAASDVVITMGCGDACPIFPGKRYEDWDLPDPADKGTDAVREIRDEIDRRVQHLLAQIVPGSSRGR